MFFLIVLFWIHGFYSTYEIAPPICTGAVSISKLGCNSFFLNSFIFSGSSIILSGPPKSSMSFYGTKIISPIIAFNNELFPEPTSPMTQTKSPFLTVKSIFLSCINLFKVFVSVFSFGLSSFVCVFDSSSINVCWVISV